MSIWSQFKTLAQPKASEATAPRPTVSTAPARPVSCPLTPPRAEAPDSDLLAAVLAQVGPQVIAPAAVPAEPTPALSGWDVPGFGRRCRVATQFGDLPIEALRRRDKVKTLSGAYREVVSIDSIRLDPDFMARHPEAHPIQVRARALGPGQPERSVLLSPAQSICVDGRVGNAASTSLTTLEGTPGISRFPQSEMVYYLFHCGTPEIVSIDGLWFPVAP